MKTSSKMMFTLILIMSTIMVLSSSSWINMWIGMEINLMSFIPMVSEPKNNFLSQSMMTYFLVQSMASMLFIVIFLLNKYIFNYTYTYVTNTMIMMIMMMKLGMPPFHMWFPEMVNKLNWKMCAVIMTWQKLAPLYVISMITESNQITMMMICLSTIMGAIGGMNQTSTRKIMAYSSINHMGWLVACTTTYKKSWIMYMTMYTIIIIMMSIMFNEYNIMYINQMNNFFSKNMEKIIIISLMLSIGGLPPFLGFLPKWITIQYLMSSNQMMMLLIMMMSSLVTLTYYLRMTSSLNLMISSSQKWMNLNLTNKNTLTMIMLTNLMLPMFIFLMNFL